MYVPTPAMSNMHLRHLASAISLCYETGMFIIANWKMHGDAERISGWVDAVSQGLPTARSPVQCILCPPSIWLRDTERLLSGNDRIMLGAQDCRAEAEGPYTGDISARMLTRAGVKYVIVGHSERRLGHGETSEDVALKCRAVKHAGMVPIVCVGETLAEREAGRAVEVVRGQLELSIAGGDAYCIVAYEPVWAIGTGRTPTLDDIAVMHREILSATGALQQSRDRAIPVVYGGSVNPSNAASILAIPEVSGALIGSASLQAESYLAIVEAAGRAV